MDATRFEGAVPLADERASQGAPLVAFHGKLELVVPLMEIVCGDGEDEPRAAVKTSCDFEVATAAAEVGLNWIDWRAMFTFTFGVLWNVRRTELIIPRQPAWPARLRV